MAKLERGELEGRVMDILWASSEPMTPREVHDVLWSRRHRVAYTTITTVLVRLWEKEMLARSARGRAYAYQPVKSRDEWTAGRMRELLRASNDRASALTHFVRSMGARDAAQLRRALGRRRRG